MGIWSSNFLSFTISLKLFWGKKKAERQFADSVGSLIYYFTLWSKTAESKVVVQSFRMIYKIFCVS